MAEQAQVWKDRGRYDPHGTGAKILVAFSGNPSSAKGAAAWATALYEKVFKGFGVGHVYSVPYHKDNTPPAELVTHFKSLVGKSLAKDIPPVFVVAHSSGSYIAHALFKQLDNKEDKGVFDKTTYYDIDGARYEGGPRCPPRNVIAIYAVSAKGGYGSRNIKSMTNFGKYATVRPVKFDDVPDKLLPEDAKDPHPPAVAAYLHRRLIVKLDPPPPQLNYEVVNARNVTTDWISDHDKDL